MSFWRCKIYWRVQEWPDTMNVKTETLPADHLQTWQNITASDRQEL